MGVSYSAVGHCIYCGASRYSDTRERLGDEHIIPEALSGELVLPRASCGRCEATINRFEQPLMKRTFGPIRYVLGLKSKRPKARPTTVSVHVRIGGQWVKRELPIEVVPTMLFMPFFGAPDIIGQEKARRSDFETREFWHTPIATADLNRLSREFGVTATRSYDVQLTGKSFALWLAKIAHGYAWAERDDIDRFRPVLPPVILQERGAPPLPYFIGSTLNVEPPSAHAHELGLMRGETPRGLAWMVRIRLFGWLGAPTYYVVVSRDPPPQP